MARVASFSSLASLSYPPYSPCVARVAVIHTSFSNNFALVPPPHNNVSNNSDCIPTYHISSLPHHKTSLKTQTSCTGVLSLLAPHPKQLRGLRCGRVLLLVLRLSISSCSKRDPHKAAISFSALELRLCMLSPNSLRNWPVDR